MSAQRITQLLPAAEQNGLALQEKLLARSIDGMREVAADDVLKTALAMRGTSFNAILDGQLRYTPDVAKEISMSETRYPPTRTSVIVTSAWSVGMLKVHQKESTLKPGASVGTWKALMPSGEPGSPDVRAKMMS